MFQEDKQLVEEICRRTFQEELAGALADFGKKLEDLEKSLAEFEKKLAEAQLPKETAKRRTSFKDLGDE